MATVEHPHPMNIIYQPILAGGIAFGIEQFYANKGATKDNMYFAVATASGVLFADLIVKNQKKGIFRTIEERFLEVGLSVG